MSATIVSTGAEQFSKDAVEALVYRAVGDRHAPISAGATRLANRPLWAIAAESLSLSGRPVDVYGDKRSIAEHALSAFGTDHQVFYSAKEGRQYIGAEAAPFANPADFPGILSGLVNKYLDTVELDDDYSYPRISALIPGGIEDFKPGTIVNKGIAEELDELQDAEQFKELGIAEEVLSYIYLRRFGNKWGWTPLMIANDDLAAFAEGMLGLEDAWQVTQNRLVVGLLASNPTLLDGSTLFANRADVGSAANNNDRTAGNPPSDTEWGAMDSLYSDISGVCTSRRVRGSLNVALVPTGSVAQEARRTFLPLNTMGLEGKVANTTAAVGIYRGEVEVVPESELRDESSQVWYGLRNPTRLNTATVVRGYFNGFGERGRRERWYDYNNKCLYVSIEGRIAVAIKNWRYVVRNAGAGAGG